MDPRTPCGHCIAGRLVNGRRELLIAALHRAKPSVAGGQVAGRSIQQHELDACRVETPRHFFSLGAVRKLTLNRSEAAACSGVDPVGES